MPPSKKAAAAAASDAALNKWLAKMDTSYGEGVFQQMEESAPYEVVSSGSLALDFSLGVGGLIAGRTYELWGTEHSGKTTLSFLLSAMHQRAHPTKRTAYIDMEHRADKSWAKAWGVDTTRMFLVRPNSAEEVADLLKDTLRSGFFSFVVVDSVGAMIPEKEMDKDAEESAMGRKAQVVTRMVQIASVEADKSGTTVLYINQVRANFAYGGDTTTPGGFALKHATTARLKIKRKSGSDIKMKVDGEELVVGYTVSVRIERNSVAPAYKTAEFVIITQPTTTHGPVGVDSADEALTLGLRTKVLQQGGAWITDTTSGERWNGRDATLKGLRADPVAVERIRIAALATVADQITEERTGEAAEPDAPTGLRRGSSEAQGDKDEYVAPEDD